MSATAEAELLRAVAADLDDPGAWQVYLDWLLEREDPRATLLRLQTAREDADDKEQKDLDKQIRKLLDEHGDAWLSGATALKLPVTWAMHRGVVGRVGGTPAKLAKHGDNILAAAPLLMGVDIDVNSHDEKERTLVPLAGSPLLARARDISLRGKPAKVKGWEHLIAPELRSLELSMLALGPDDLEAIVAIGYPKLESLRVSWCRFNKRALEPLAKLDAPKLARVDFAACHVGPPLGEILARFPALRQIRIPGNEIGSEGLAALRDNLANVTHLDLRGNDLAPSDVPPLLRAIENVTVLKLGGNSLGSAGAEAVAAWSGAARLTQLDIGHDNDEGALAIANSKHLSPALEKLTLGARGVAESVEHALLDAPRLANARIYVGMKMLGRKKREDELAKTKKTTTAKRKKK